MLTILYRSENHTTQWMKVSIFLPNEAKLEILCQYFNGTTQLELNSDTTQNIKPQSFVFSISLFGWSWWGDDTLKALGCKITKNFKEFNLKKS